MTIDVKRLEGEAIIVVTWPGELEPDQQKIASAEVNRLIGEDETGVVRIDDMSSINFNFSTVVMGMAEARSEKPGYPRDPRLKNIIVGKDNTLMSLITKAAGQDQYGRLRIPLYFSLEEALAAVRRGEV
jgi:hypothetical protein